MTARIAAQKKKIREYDVNEIGKKERTISERRKKNIIGKVAVDGSLEKKENSRV
jgi:hypothetical protein